MSIETNNEQENFQTSGVAMVSSAHAVHDTYTAFLPALLPVLIQKFTLTNTAAGMLSVFLQIPSLLQPVIGHIADHKNLKMLIILTPAISGAAMSLLGIAPNYGFLAFLLILAGVSSAALHAVGPGLGSNLSGNKLGRGMSFWMVAGELGRALGPVVVVTAIGYLTLERLPWLALGGILASFFLYSNLQSISTLPVGTQTQGSMKEALLSMRSVMFPVSILVFTRSMVSAVLTTYLPTFLTDQGSSLWIAGASLTILQISGMVGAFLAGPLSDKFGRRKMLAISYVVTPLLMLLFIYTNEVWRIPLLTSLGLFAISVGPVFLAIILEHSNENRSLTNGVFMALSFILQALAVLLVGLISDWADLRFTLLISTVLLPIGLPFIFMLPKSKKTT